MGPSPTLFGSAVNYTVDQLGRPRGAEPGSRGAKLFPGFSISESAVLLAEAAEARLLASECKDAASVRDLLLYATAVEADVAREGERSQNALQIRAQTAVQLYRGPLQIRLAS
jgi:hypothetical protein